MKWKVLCAEEGSIMMMMMMLLKDEPVLRFNELSALPSAGGREFSASAGT
jgi:hypothetical protein